MPDGVRPVERERQPEHGDRHHERRPHRHRQPLQPGPRGRSLPTRGRAAVRRDSSLVTRGRALVTRGRAQVAADAGASGDDVPHRPRRRCGERHDEREGRRRGAAAHADDDQPGRPDQHAHELRARRDLAQRRGGEQHGEPDLGLEHERREPGGHAERERGVQQAELAEAHERADEQHVPPPRAGPRHEEHRRDQDDEEAQGDEQRRRHVAEPEVDDDEVHAPDDGDEDGEEGRAQRHGIEGAPAASCTSSAQSCTVSSSAASG